MSTTHSKNVSSPPGDLQSLADLLMQKQGHVRGEALLTNAKFIEFKEGEAGVRKVEEQMKKLGYPVVFAKVKSFEWYKEALGVLAILVAKELFHWGEKEIYQMGNFSPQRSFIVKLLMKYFLEPKRSFLESPRYWQKNFDFGKLEPITFNEKEKFLTLRVMGYSFHPIMCIYHQGYFVRVAEFVLESEHITIEETACVHKGAPYHEYIIRWK